MTLVKVDSAAGKGIDLYLRRCGDMDVWEIRPGKAGAGLPVVNEKLTPISVQDPIQICSNLDRPGRIQLQIIRNNFERHLEIESQAARSPADGP